MPRSHTDSEFGTPEALRAAKIREAEARTRLLLIDEAKARRELVSMDEACGMVNRVLGAVRSQVLAMPASLGAKANPNDPKFGMLACQSWVDGFLRHCADVNPDEEATALDKAKPERKRIRGSGGKR